MNSNIIGLLLNSLLKEYNEGACDSLNEQDQNKLFAKLQDLYSTVSKMQEKTYTIEEASLFLNVTRQSIYNYTKKGILHPTKQKGGVLQFKESELNKLKYKKGSKNE